MPALRDLKSVNDVTEFKNEERVAIVGFFDKADGSGTSFYFLV